MKTTFITLLIFCFIILNSKAQDIDRSEYECVKEEILNEINKISEIFGPHLGPRDRQFLEHRLDEIAAKLNYLSQETSRNYAVYPMPDSDFNLLMLMLENESMENDKLMIIQKAVVNNYFMIAQLTQLLEKFSFEDNRVKVIGILYPAILDKEKSFQLYNYLTFSSSKEKLNQIILENSPDNR
jgi:hypothetical protein